MTAIRNTLLLLMLGFSGAFGLVACETLGIAKPQTFNQKVAVAYSAVTEVRTQATILLKADRISVADAQNVQEQANNARAAIDVARSLRATQPAAADSRLASTITALTALQAYLASRR